MGASVRDGTNRDAILLVELSAPGELTADVLTAVSPSASHGLTATHQDQVNSDLLTFLQS
jgi:hypothetical protein